MRDPNRFDGQDPWIVPPRSFGETASDAERFRYLLRYAVLAPSSHNSQPWLFHIAADALELYADRSRRLPVADPDDRELTISCGAALFNLRLAMRCFGAEARVQLLPDTRRPDLLARVQFGDTRPRDEADERMLTAIVSRRTNRGAFEFRPVPQAILGDLQDCAYREGAWLRTLTDVDELDAIAELVAEADRRQATDPAFRAELARWVHPDRAATRDGMPGYALGIGGLSSHAAPLILRTFDWGDGKAAHDRQIIAGSPALAVLGTDKDRAVDWLLAGQALQHVLLAARAAGLYTSFLNQPLEVADLRTRLIKALSGRGSPQLIVRMGYGVPVRPTPRRSVTDVIIP